MATTAADSKSVIDHAINTMGDIATLPQVTIKIIEIVEDPKSTARELHEVIKNDPALSAKVLKVVNSAFYGLPGQIANVDRAIVLLGLAAVKNIAIAASIARLFKGSQISEHFSAADLWRHSVAVAVAARKLAKYSPKIGNPDDMFVAGLIHDIGMLIERQAYPDEFATVLNRCMTEEIDFIQCEQQVIGADHQAFGTALTTKWKFPRHLRAAVGFHHQPESLSDELKVLGTTIQIADILACQCQLGLYLTAKLTPITEDMLEVVGLTPEQLGEVMEYLPEGVSDAEAALGNN